MLPILLCSLGLTGFVAWSFAGQRHALPAGATEVDASRMFERSRLLVRMCEVMGFGIVASLSTFWLLIAASWLPGYASLLQPALVVASVGTGAAASAPLVVYLPRLARVTDALTAAGAPPGIGTHPSGWKLGGAIYWAPEDPAIWAPKRVGFGSTVNFARPSAWVLLVVLIVAPGVIIAIVNRLQ